MSVFVTLSGWRKIHLMSVFCLLDMVSHIAGLNTPHRDTRQICKAVKNYQILSNYQICLCSVEVMLAWKYFWVFSKYKMLLFILIYVLVAVFCNF